jgi:ABC-2 type transport system ATP-binding protein
MISINDLTFNYSPEQPLFDGLNLQIQAGDLFGLVGPNGAGKSTLISLACGLQTAHSGSIEINGLDLASQRKAILQDLAVVPQDYAFYPKLSARENLEFFVNLYPGIRSAEKQIELVMEMTGLASFAQRQARTYSGGMKRRLNLAIGLLNRPRILILDEPTVGIDPQSRHFILEAIRQINNQGTTILYTSHYMEEVEKLCKQVAVIDHGRIIISGNIKNVLEKNTHFRARLANDVLLHDPGLASLVQQYGLHIQDGYLQGEMLGMDQCMAIISSLAKAGIEIENLHCGKQSLESLFFELTDTRLREK